MQREKTASVTLLRSASSTRHRPVSPKWRLQSPALQSVDNKKCLNKDEQTTDQKYNKCIRDDTKAAARQSLNCIKKKIWRKTIINMPCVACGSGIVTVNSPSGSTLQCDTWLWDDMPLNLPKRVPYWNSTTGFYFHISPQSTCHSVPGCKILSISDLPRQKKITSYRFSRWRISAILDCRDPIMGSLRSSVKLT